MPGFLQAIGLKGRKDRTAAPGTYQVPPSSARNVPPAPAVRPTATVSAPPPTHQGFPSPGHNVPAAPPAYSNVNPEDSTFNVLSEYDTIFLVDDSSSMSCNATRALAEFARIAARYDEDGIDVHFLNNPTVGEHLTNPEQVMQLFKTTRPVGKTFLGARLQRLVDAKYLEELASAAREEVAWPKRRNYLIITDGEADDEDVLENFLRRTAETLMLNKVPRSQIGFQFIQIGDDPQATAFLEKLDGDNLKLPVDIVDTVPTRPGQAFSPEFLKKVILGGISDNYDKTDS
ncbi:hypothetical protein FA15DRAFT_652358 [Coprinopsis marcescibilis]|uniref:VWFA domain-containing protein n=1 Tax=Coprinopsis marcescibilis TaxID=230819 RepID=A0A5C3L8V5_COPMA|nr:hypothetical protein FA15DRAFT_652358 [Coprinopsis marcescibilis]